MDLDYNELYDDLRARSENNWRKFSAVVDGFIAAAQDQGDALFDPRRFPFPDELRDMATEGIVATLLRPEVATDAAALMVHVAHARQRPDLVALFGSEDVEARSLVWALALAWSEAPRMADGDA